MNGAGNSEEAVGRARVVRDAAARGLSVRVVERPDAHGLFDAAEKMGIEPSDIVKTLVVKQPGGRYLFALIPGGRKISWPKLRALVGVNKLAMPDAAVALEATGYPRGTITPLGALGDWPVFADVTMKGREVSMGAGELGYTMFVNSDALIRSFHATVADISDPE
jgi:Cys-tRNA(Pro)/Cys-tRNA(Cys) deacylase